ncbi:MAG: short-chain dehydrogenase [Sphingobacteriales bacterium]|nr:short-chain dehydrogenase [Sphingobacteriales bacterium]
MTTEQIEKFVGPGKRKDNKLNIHFKDRQPVTGVFIQEADYEELKSKNLWRIVSGTHLKEWEQKKDLNLSRIFNGISFTRLTEA